MLSPESTTFEYAKYDQMNSLRYEPLRQYHNDALTSVWCDEDVIRYTSIGTPCTRKEVETKCSLLQDHDVFAIFRGNDFLGIVGCLRMDCKKKLFGLFYQLRKSAWGQRNGTEAVGWLLNFMRKKYSRFILVADVIVDNIASEKILKHYGFQLISEENFTQKNLHSKIRRYQLKS